MRRINIFILLLFCLVLICFSQKEINKDKLIKKNNLYYEKNSKYPFSGIAIKKHPDSKWCEKIPIKDGLIHGKWVLFSSDGLQIGEGIFENGDGTFVLYYNFEKKKILARTPYKENYKHGKEIRYDEDGTIFYECFYRKDKMDGKEIGWYENQNVFIEKEWKNGMFHGKWLEWYKSGKKEAEGDFTNGRGKLLRWYEDGKKKSISFYKDNLEDGKSIGWHRNGKKAFEIDYEKDMVHGNLIEWDKNGKLVKHEIYEKGHFVEKINLRRD